MPKKIDWDSIRQDFIESDLTYTALAQRHGVSRQSVEKRGSDEGWQVLRQSLKRQESMVAQEVQQDSEFNLDNVLKKAIALSFEQLQTAQPRSFEGTAESICKLAEVYLRLNPPKPHDVAGIVDMILDLRLDPVEVLKQFKARALELG
jgi:hypothetical protein